MPKTLKGKLFLLYSLVTLIVSVVLLLNLIDIYNNANHAFLHFGTFIPAFVLIFILGAYYTDKYTKPLNNLTTQAANLLENLDKEVTIENGTRELKYLSASVENLRKKIILHLMTIENNTKYRRVAENLTIELQKDLSLSYRAKKVSEAAVLITSSDFSNLSLIDRKKSKIYMTKGFKLPPALRRYLSGKNAIKENLEVEEDKIVINDCCEYYKGSGSEIINQGIGSMATFRFEIKNDLIAVLQVFSKETGYFTNEKLAVLEHVTNSVGLAFSNAILHRNENYSRSFTENVLQNIPVAMVVVSYPELSILKANELFNNFCNKDEVLGNQVLEYFPRHIKIKLLKFIENVCKVKKHVFYKEIKFHDGSYKNISVIPTLEGEEIINFVITLHECTEEVQMRRKLQRLLSQQKQHAKELETIFTSLQNGLMITNQEADVIKWNEKALEIIEYKEDMVNDLSKKKFHIFDVDGKKLEYERLPAIRILNEPFLQEVYLIKTPKSNRKFISVSGAALKDENDEPQGGVFTIEDLTGLMTIQDKLKLNLNKKREWQEKLKTLNKASLQISRTTNIDKILEIAGKTARELTDSEIVSIYTLNDDQKHVKDLYVDVPEEFQHDHKTQKADFEVSFHGSLYSKCMREGIPQIINDIDNYSEKTGVPKWHVPLNGLLVLPLTSSTHKIMGLMYVSNKKDGRKYTVEDKNIAHSLAVHTSIALTNAYNYKREKRVSHLLQKSMLPILPTFENVEFDYAYEAATSGVMVGGDFFDIIELEDGKLGIVIADVAGKGIEAATITSTIKNTIRAFALENLSPGDILSRTNKVLFNQGMPNFATCLVGILDISLGKLAYANAGHHPAILYKNRLGSAIFLQKGSSPLGVLSEEIYEDFSADVNPLDTLLFYTDGLVEARINGELFGEKRLVKSVLKYCHGARPVRFIVQDVERFSKNKFHDDIAILSVKLLSLTRERDQLNLRLGRLFNN